MASAATGAGAAVQPATSASAIDIRNRSIVTSAHGRVKLRREGGGGTIGRGPLLRAAALHPRHVLQEPRHELDEVAWAETVVELMHEDVIPGVATGAGRSRHGKQIRAAGDAGSRTRLDRRGTDLLERQVAEQL